MKKELGDSFSDKFTAFDSEVINTIEELCK